MPAQDHLRQVVQPLGRPASYVSRAAKAAAYPLRGVYYFLRHREYYPFFLSRLLPLSIISLLVYTILFTFTFLPQYAFLAIFHGWGAWVNAVVLVLGEGLIIVQGLFEGFFVDECRVDVFDVSTSPNSGFTCMRQDRKSDLRHRQHSLTKASSTSSLRSASSSSTRQTRSRSLANQRPRPSTNHGV